MELIPKNKSKADCAIVAAYNALILSGGQTSYEHVLNQARAWCGFRPTVGLKRGNMTKLLKCLNVPFAKFRNGTPFERILHAMFEGHTMLFCYNDVERGIGHSIVVAPNFKLINPGPGYKTWAALFQGICNRKVKFEAWIVTKQ